MRSSLMRRLFGVLAALLMAACSATTNNTTPTQPGATVDPNKEFVLASADDIVSMDPAFFIVPPAEAVGLTLYNSLVRYKWHQDTIEVEPDLAERWEYSTDRKTLTFFLRKGVQFHKSFGEFTSADVKFHFDRLKDPNTKSPGLRESSLIDRIETPDPYTARFFLKTTSPNFLEALIAYRWGLIPSKKAIEQYGADYSKSPIGTGPYQLESWTPRQEIKFVANEQYFRGTPKIKRARLAVIPDETVQALAVQKGEVHGILVRAPEVFKIVKDKPDVTVVGNSGSAYRGAFLNATKKPLSDVRVRRALAYAIDRPGLATALENMHTVAWGIVPKGMFGYTDNVTKYTTDIARAKQLLVEAGYPNGGFTLNVILASIDKTMSEVLSAAWAQIGVQTKIEILEAGAFSARAFAPARDYDVLLGGKVRATPEQIVTEMDARAFTHSGLSLPRVSTLIDEYRAEADASKRATILGEIQKIGSDELPILVLVHSLNVTVYHKSVQGWASNHANWFFVIEEMSFR
jgi:ABC-type transport system substrate-binding protein